MRCPGVVVVSGLLHTELQLRIDSFSNLTRGMDIEVKGLRQLYDKLIYLHRGHVDDNHHHNHHHHQKETWTEISQMFFKNT